MTWWTMSCPTTAANVPDGGEECSHVTGSYTDDVADDDSEDNEKAGYQWEPP